MGARALFWGGTRAKPYKGAGVLAWSHPLYPLLVHRPHSKERPHLSGGGPNAASHPLTLSYFFNTTTTTHYHHYHRYTKITIN